MGFEDYQKTLNKGGLVIVEGQLLRNLLEESQQALDQCLFSELKTDQTSLLDFQSQLSNLRNLVVKLNLQAGLIPCSMPGCENSADISTTLGIHFCESCNTDRLQAIHCGQ